MEFFKPRATIDFMKYRAPIISGSLLLALLGFLSIFWPGPNYGIDFKGGTEVQLQFKKDIAPEKVREVLSEKGYDAEVVNVEGRANEYLVRVGRVSSLPADKVESIKKSLQWQVTGVKIEEFKVSPGGDKITLRMVGEVEPSAIEGALKTAGANVQSVSRFGNSDQHRYEVHLVGVANEIVKALEDKLGDGAPDAPLRVEWVGPKAGKQLRDAAVKSLLWTVLFIMAYVAMRFDLRFAPGGIVALLHDTLITVLVFVITRREVNLSTVAALLTILGYSINDTIVIFDRIRENMTRMREASLYQLINISTTQTLSRSILTSFVTLLSILPFLIWGTPVIRDFALALVIGMVVGSYSTIYIAAPFTEWMDRKLFAKA
ncbi:MAG TPA: protein translocase subunit SecF [Polyangiales bacterium]|nr:protein translocase subunit SecF [Polyangiales bacterium]